MLCIVSNRMCATKKFVLVYKTNVQVLEDYIDSLRIFKEVIEIDDFAARRKEFLHPDIVIVFTQMWLDLDNFSPEIYNSPNFIFLNVENLTEQRRMDHVMQFIKKGIKVADYSLANIRVMKTFATENNIDIRAPILYFPYQYNDKENALLVNREHKYDYDVGVVNACPKKDASVNASLTYKRTKIWEDLEFSGMSCVNILGWGKERDEIIKKCKVIVNVHHFECYKIFQHIRCDRLVFANKLVVSEHSLVVDDLDIKNHVMWADYNNILETTLKAVGNFDHYMGVLSSIDATQIAVDRARILQKTICDIEKGT
jgi:hypothetical protein